MSPTRRVSMGTQPSGVETNVPFLKPFPPLFIAAANISNPRIKEIGPEAVPPPCSGSLEPRMGERLVPVPLPYLNSIPSVLARVRIEAISSSTLLIKQAEH